MTYRLHIDIPINGSEEDALKKASEIIRFCFDNHIAEKQMRELGVEVVNYRLGHDEDRQKSNYFVKNENGHVNNKKSKVNYLTSSEQQV
jgi:hypothetical protein